MKRSDGGQLAAGDHRRVDKDIKLELRGEGR